MILIAFSFDLIDQVFLRRRRAKVTFFGDVFCLHDCIFPSDKSHLLLALQVVCLDEMGGVVSSDTNLEENAVLRRFTGLETISDNDPFWNQLLSFNMKVDHNNRCVLAFPFACTSRFMYFARA